METTVSPTASSKYEQRVRIRGITAGWLALALTAAILAAIGYGGCRLMSPASPPAAAPATFQ